jgi:hypothetical protein
MKVKSNIGNSNSSTPVVFRSEFNHFENISATQAWSLFFTASHRDTSFGESMEAGRFWNLLLLGAVSASILAAVVF